MKNKALSFSVFTKPWKTIDLDELGRFISGLGFDGIEFPLREGYQIEPSDAEKGLPRLAEKMRGYGLNITSVASVTEEKVFAGCEAAGIPIIRILGSVDPGMNFIEAVEKKKKELYSIIPLCEKYGIKVGVQHHYGPGINNSMELRNLIEDFDPKYIGAIWDAAHSALAGEEPEQALDIVWPYLCMINLKNAVYSNRSLPGQRDCAWERRFTLGREGLSSWKRVSDIINRKKYNGVICLTAEYSDEDQVNKLIAEDIAYAKSLF